MIRDEWTYHRAKRFDRNKVRWHFVTRYFEAPKGGDEPRELYFRNDDETEFGMIRFDRFKDYPYRDWDFLMTKILNNIPFRRSLLNEDTRTVWKKNWK
ncbi:MAG: hypothetical protein KA746_07710 [Pyrinomonadaceae bacterium]|nr:hypothetical protein [Pyrinomonadaceae bacterium]